MSEYRELLKSVAPLACSAGVLVVLWVLISCGVGSQMSWPVVNSSPSTPDTVSPPAEGSEPPLTLKQYAKVWSEPLFNPERQPDKLNVAPEPVKPVPPLTGYVLTGIIVTQQVKVALLKANTGEAVSAREGQTLSNGWRLDQINERQVNLVYEQNRRTLEISTPRLPMTFP